MSSDKKLAPTNRKKHVNGLWQVRAKGPYVASTYVSIGATCPSDCMFRGGACYVTAAPATAKLNRDMDAAVLSHGLSGLDVAKLEACAIDDLWPTSVPQDGARGGRDLRLHVGGDTPAWTRDLAALILASAAERWLSRGGGRVWTYTANWRRIRRSSFGPIQTLASVQSVEQADEAVERGYAPALTAVRHGQTAYKLGAVKVIPCPAEWKPGVTCSSCRLCTRHLPKGTAIGFSMHGANVERFNRELPLLNKAM